MKLRIQREHYTTRDGGKTWIPKRAYDSEEQIQEEKAFPSNMTHSYICSVCKKYHIGRDRDESKPK